MTQTGDSSVRSDAASGIVRLASSNVFAAFGVAATTPVLTHVLGVRGQGIVAGATAPLLLATVAATLGLPTAVTYAVARSPFMFRGVVARAAVATAVAGGLVTMAVFLLAGRIIHRGQTGHLMVIASLFLTPALLIGVVRGAALGLQRWQLLLHEQVLVASASLLTIGVLLVIGDLTVVSATLVTAATPLAGAPVYLRLLRKPTVYSPRPAGPPRLVIGRLTTYALRSWVGSLAGIVLERVDQSLMAWLSNPHQLGLYSVAVNVSQAALMVNGAIATVMFAREAASPDTAGLARAGRVSTLLVFTGAAVTAAASWLLLQPVFGEGFGAAFLPLVLLLVSVVVGNPGSVGSAALAARGAPGRRSLALMCACAVNVGVVLLLVPRLGATGAAIAAIAGTFTAGNLGLVFLWRSQGIPPASFLRLQAADVGFLLSRSWSLLRGVRESTT